MTLRERALQLLLLTDADRKARETQALEQAGPVDAAAVIAEPAGIPGRPARPVLVPHTQLRRGSLATREGHAALLHAVAHYAVLTERHQAPRPQPPFNEHARRQAGFSAEELARLRR